MSDFGSATEIQNLKSEIKCPSVFSHKIYILNDLQVIDLFIKKQKPSKCYTSAVFVLSYFTPNTSFKIY